MYMLAVDVAVFEYIVGLVAEAHALHVLAGNRSKLIFGKPVFRMRIERNMEHGIFRSAVGFQIGFEGLHGPVDIQP